ncbi:MAG: hypothetical protein AB1633_13295, partial [Elusimicrobiota bacterium]
MIKTLLLLVDFISSPKTAIEEIRVITNLYRDVLVLLLAFLSQQAAGSLIFLNSGKQSLLIFCMTFLLTFSVLIITLVIFCAWSHFLAGLFNAQSNVKILLAAICLSFAPLFFLLPVSSILLVWIPNFTGWYVFTVFIVYLWIACLLFASI